MLTVNCQLLLSFYHGLLQPLLMFLCEEIKFSATYFGYLLDLDLLESRQIEGEDLLDAYAIRDFADREGATHLFAVLDGDDATFEILYALLFFTLDILLFDLLEDADNLADLDFGEILGNSLDWGFCALFLFGHKCNIKIEPRRSILDP